MVQSVQLGYEESNELGKRQRTIEKSYVNPITANAEEDTDAACETRHRLNSTLSYITLSAVSCVKK